MFSITEDFSADNPAAEDEDEWQDIEVSEDWGPQTPLTPLNDDDDDLTRPSSRHVIQCEQRYSVRTNFCIRLTDLLATGLKSRIFRKFYP